MTDLLVATGTRHAAPRHGGRLPHGGAGADPQLQGPGPPDPGSAGGGGDTYRIEAGGALFRESEPFGNVVYVLYDGAMRQYRSTGFECEVHHQDDFLALANYVDRTPFRSTVEAVSDCVVLGQAACARQC